MPAEPLLRCEQLVKFHETPSGRVQAVRGVDLSFSTGVTVAIVGPSGSGKSSLLRMLACLDRPSAGVVKVDGVDLWRLSERARARTRAALMTHVYQRPGDNLFGHLTAEMQLERVARSGSGSDGVDRWLDALGLAGQRTLLPAQMSGGERQRLAFARAAVSGHRLVIADEPTAQLDSANSRAVLDAVDVLAGRGMTTIVATHDRRVLDRVDEVIELRDGAIATITSGGTRLSVIDTSGRLQLPPELLGRFPDGRARLRWGADSEPIELDAP
jgi:ABC-type lipoprotein export system ATPase subunit